MYPAFMNKTKYKSTLTLDQRYHILWNDFGSEPNYVFFERLDIMFRTDRNVEPIDETDRYYEEVMP